MQNLRNNLHIASCDKFIPPFVKLINQEFDIDSHCFVIKSGMADSKLKLDKNVLLFSNKKLDLLKYYANIAFRMSLADRIILHSLLDIKIITILFFMPWCLPKCYWFIWGADLYRYNARKKNFKSRVKEFLRRIVFKKIGYLVTYVKGDFELAKEWYNSKGKFVECIMYTSNLYTLENYEKKEKENINILLGNSSDPTNNHIDSLERLLPFKGDNIKIYSPLSYGDPAYADKINSIGKQWFGERFIAIRDFMSLEQYNEFLTTIDIAIFNHDRQQAMGNTIKLLGLGKTVYIRENTSQWEFFNEKEISVKSIEKLESLSYSLNEVNVKKVRDYFSLENYLKQLNYIFK